MKKLMIASACILALSIGGAYAQQMQPAPGASSMGNVGPGATGKTRHSAKHAMKQTKHMATAKHATKHTGKHMTTAKHVKEGTTTGMTTGMAPRRSKSMSANPSSSGNVGPGTNNNTGPQPGGR